MTTRLDAPGLHRMVAFIAIVCSSTGGLLVLNQHVKLRTSGAETGGELYGRLEALVREPLQWGLTMVPETRNERTLRWTWAPALPTPLDVVVLGQSDADHMSATFFREPRRFYNGFVSSSHFAYQWEVLDALLRRGNVPKIVLWDVRSGEMLESHVDPAFDGPADAPGFFAGPLFLHGAPPVPRWYDDVPSLLSLAQTSFTLATLWKDVRAGRAAVQAGADDGKPFVLLPAASASTSHRWLSDGSRVYPAEVDGKLVPRGQPGLEEARGERVLNEESLLRLDELLGKAEKAGVSVIVYAPPLSPLAAESPSQQAAYAAFDARTRAVVEKRGVDFCNLTARARTIGCTADDDFYDELHLGRRCDARVVHELVSGCAPRRGGELARYVTDDVARGSAP